MRGSADRRKRSASIGIFGKGKMEETVYVPARKGRSRTIGVLRSKLTYSEMKRLAEEHDIEWRFIPKEWIQEALNSMSESEIVEIEFICNWFQ